MMDLDASNDGFWMDFPQAANWNLGASLPELLAIARRATQEHYVEVALEKLKETWSASDASDALVVKIHDEEMGEEHDER